MAGYTGASYVILSGSLFAGKILGLELFGVMQLSYFMNSGNSNQNIY